MCFLKESTQPINFDAGTQRMDVDEVLAANLTILKGNNICPWTEKFTIIKRRRKIFENI